MDYLIAFGAGIFDRGYLIALVLVFLIVYYLDAFGAGVSYFSGYIAVNCCFSYLLEFELDIIRV